MKRLKKFVAGLMLVLAFSMLTACSNKDEDIKETETNKVIETSSVKETIMETTGTTEKGVVEEVGEDIIDGAETVVDDVKDKVETNVRETNTEETVE
jgi:gas vesicle protein